ncbi:MAG: Unknown protein [uncultured Sulfurovum sp.]|uniref:Uncharacterized protein n=1 Tax=uncultured Sulfurovum sp. TaxID=269237 RepID=A0A6S6TX07_9BACT|nr:MAG: Unknown protein [uncultured Sulfurovum sp.]
MKLEITKKSFKLETKNTKELIILSVLVITTILVIVLIYLQGHLNECLSMYSLWSQITK